MLSILYSFLVKKKSLRHLRLKYEYSATAEEK